MKVKRLKTPAELKPGEEISPDYTEYVEDIFEPPKVICKSCFDIYSKLLSIGVFDRPNLNTAYTAYCQVCKSQQDYVVDNPFGANMIWYARRKNAEGLPKIMEHHKNNTLIKYASDTTMLKFAGSLYLSDLSILAYGLSFIDNTEDCFTDIRLATPKEISLFRKSLKLDKLA